MTAKPTSKSTEPKLESEKLLELGISTQELLFKEYSAWARHHHVLVWTATAFGVTILLATIILYKDLEPLPYTAAALGSLVLLYCSHMLAEGNRRQWQDYKSVPNLIEASWKLRKPGSQTQLNMVDRQREIRVQPWRLRLYWTLAIIVLVTIIVKWVEYLRHLDSIDG